MKLLNFESKKVFRSAGFVYLCVGMLILNLLFCIFADIPSPTEAEIEEYIANYESDISYVIRVAERNLLEYEATVGGENYIVRYQRDIIGRYTNLLEKEVKPAAARGWNEFFENHADDLLPMLAAVIAGVLITMTERDNGTHTLLNMTAKGRKSIRAKLVFLALFSVAAVILMNAVTIAGIALRFGLSSPDAPLCSVKIFEYCPYDITILTYLLITVPIKAANLFAISMIAALPGSYLLGLSLPLAITLAGFGISSLKSANDLIYFNPYTVGLCDPLFERYRSLNIFDCSVPLLIVACALTVILCVSFALIYRMTFSRGVGGSALSKIEKSISSFFVKIKEKTVLAIPRAKVRRHGLLFAEAKKSFVKSHLILLCILMIGVKVWYSSSTAPDIYAAEEYYRGRCRELCGELTEEKRALIKNELAECREIMSKYNSMRNALMLGSITNDEFSAYLDEHSIASVGEYAYSKLAVQCARIDEAAARGQDAKIIYDSGWNAYFDSGFDIILYLFLLLFFCGIYENEYKIGFDRIADTTASGMRALHKAKLKLAVIVTVFAFVAFAGVDIYRLLAGYTLPNASFPLASVKETALSLPLFGAMTLKYIAEMAVAIAFSFTVCLLSHYLRRIYAVIPVGLLIVWAISAV